MSPPAPTATSATPSADIAAATQKREVGRSVPSARPKSAAKIGMAPRTSPIVEAVVRSSANTKETWLRKSSPAASTRIARWRRETRSVRST